MTVERWTLWPCPKCGEVLASDPDDSGCDHIADDHGSPGPALRMAEPVEVAPLSNRTGERWAILERYAGEPGEVVVALFHYKVDAVAVTRLWNDTTDDLSYRVVAAADAPALPTIQRGQS